MATSLSEVRSELLGSVKALFKADFFLKKIEVHCASGIKCPCDVYPFIFITFLKYTVSNVVILVCTVGSCSTSCA